MTTNSAESIVSFLKNRIFLIDATKHSGEFSFQLEELFKNYCVKILNYNSICCSCDDFVSRNTVCKHCKFVINRLNKLNSRRSKSYNSIQEYFKILYIYIKKDIDLELLNSCRNPRFKEYKLLTDGDSEGSCYICLENLKGRVNRCKTCHKYYHDRCIYAWLRTGPACTCPNCRSMWT